MKNIIKFLRTKKILQKIYLLNFIFDNSADKIYINVLKIDKDKKYLILKNGKILRRLVLWKMELASIIWRNQSL